MGFETDESVAAELLLFVENDRDLYERMFKPIVKNMMRKVKRGVYDPAKAVQGFLYLMDEGAKRYAAEFGGTEAAPGATWHDMFPRSIRQMAAKEMSERIFEEIQSGEYDHLLEKPVKESPVKTAQVDEDDDGYVIEEDQIQRLDEALQGESTEESDPVGWVAENYINGNMSAVRDYFANLVGLQAAGMAMEVYRFLAEGNQTEARRFMNAILRWA